MTKKPITFKTVIITDPKWARYKRDSNNHARHLPIFDIKYLCDQTYDIYIKLH